jgi:uncharacterized membrane protein YbhN (UPF0104 family)
VSASGSTSALVRLIPRLVVAGGGLALAAFLVLPEDRSSFWQAMHSAWRGDITLAFACLAAAGAILGTSFGVAALRFQTLLAGAGIALPWRTLLRAYVVASFFNLILPGAVLGDVYRFLDTRRDAGQASLVLGLMILERLLGLSALGCLCLMALPAIPLSHASPLGRGALALFALAFTALPLIPCILARTPSCGVGCDPSRSSLPDWLTRRSACSLPWPRWQRARRCSSEPSC